eukprot:CAMPEP_0181081652 /NCGR_PEP_ID=MMETSP1071-20121207/3210_1 /TAXON_ID=35127 /ORGANISM="Thalassiosira sp., Strain NH16" /LENGTH=891 /DNA_ID=CAMNT_0023163201 /DNA_START=148 /DNA_END=2823 /DNA_ORIENTATION=+
MTTSDEEMVNVTESVVNVTDSVVRFANLNVLTTEILNDSDDDELERLAGMRSRRTLNSKSRDSLSYFFDESIHPTQIMASTGRGGTSRMFARGKDLNDELSSVGNFFQRGSTLWKATAFTKTAVASDRNSPAGTSRGGVSCELGSEDHPVQEMEFFNIGGAKVYFYYGLDVIRAPEHVMNAGPHVRDTAVGVLMLDQYKIHERPGDPSNPLTFWPYQAFFVIPQGITFQKCKDVGSCGSNALRDYPLETSAICQALLALAEVASKHGYKRLMIVGDCGYYGLAAEAFARNLSCWGDQSWVPHPDSAFASFRSPRFRSPHLDLDIILCLGTTQLIASPEPEKNLSTQLGANTSVVYLTADACGFYSGDAQTTVSEEYAPFMDRPWNSNEWHFNLNGEVSMFDLVARVNSSILNAVGIKSDDGALEDIFESLLEISTGSTSYLVGLFLGDTASQMREYGETSIERAWIGCSHLTELIQGMAQNDDGKPHPKDVIIEKVAPVFEYIESILLRIDNVYLGSLPRHKVWHPDGTVNLTEESEFRMLALLLGNPGLNGNPPPPTYKEFKLDVALRIQDTFLSLLEVRKHADNITGLPIGVSYVEFLASFLANLNRNVLSTVEASHGIDGKTFPLFDCRYVPGFGFAVANSLTVWTRMSNYHWMSAILLRFSEIMQEKGWMGAAAYHMECTELFSFTPFFHEMGIPVVDGVNGVLIASRLTDAPMRFVNFKQKNNEPQTPSALVADVSEDPSSYYRDNSMPLRTPTLDSEVYEQGMYKVKRTLMIADKKRWSMIKLAQPLYEDFKLLYGFKSYDQSRFRPGDSIYPASSALDIGKYVDDDDDDDDDDVANPSEILEHFVQYAQIKDEKELDSNFHSFFGGDKYRDRCENAHRVTVKES